MRQSYVEDGIPYVVPRLFNGFPYLKKVTLANSVKQIHELAFAACPSLDEVILPEGLAEIGYAAFVDAVSLEAIEFPQTLEIIREEAFVNCSSLKQITFNGSAPEIGAEAFAGVTATVYYPAGDESWKNVVYEDFGGILTWVRQGDPVEDSTEAEYTEAETQEPTETETQQTTEPEQQTESSFDYNEKHEQESAVSSLPDNRWWVIPVAVFATAGVVGGIVCLRRNCRKRRGFM